MESERFDIIRRLGLGGSGEVYEVLDKKLGRHVALKTVRCTSPEQVAAVKSEFRAIRDLRHPNLVSIGELFQDGDRWSFTMELVEGRDLATWFGMHRSAAGSGQLSTPARAIAELRGVLTELADAIRALHQIGKHHLDIKPSNVLVTDERRVVLIDYGLVGSGGVTDDGTMIGTLAYVAPERLSRRPITDATDWYSFGVLAYQLIAGELPYGDDAATLQRLAKLSGPPPRDPLAWAPPDLVDLVMDLLDADPSRRPAANEIIDRLGARARLRVPSSSNSMPFTAIAVPHAAMAASEALERALSATTALVLDGEAGTGKTATLDALCAEAAEHGARVLRSSAPAHELTAFNGLDALVDRLVEALRALSDVEQIELLPASISALARVFPELERVPRVQTMHDAEGFGIDFVTDNAAHALAALIGALARKQLVVLVIDDMQRWDRDALQLFERAVVRFPVANVAIIAAARGREGNGPGIAQLLRDGGIEPVVVELAATPASNRTRIHHAIERLTPTARRLLDALAASVVPLPRDLAIAIAQIPPVEAGACLRELTRSGLVDASDEALSVDEARPIVLDRLLPAMVDDWRRRIAPALQAGDADAAIIARAYFAAGDRERCAAAARRAAAESKARGAVELAAELLRMVIDAGEDTVEARLDWIGAAREAGHARIAATELVQLAARDPANAVAHRRLAGLLRLQVGEIDDGLALLRDTDGIALPTGGTRTLLALGWARLTRGPLRVATVPDPALVPRVDVLWSVAGALGMVDSMRGALVQTKCLTLALRSGDRGHAARAIASEACFRAASLPDHAEIAALLDRADQLAIESADRHAAAWIAACRGIVAVLYGDWVLAVEQGLAADAQLLRIAGTHWERAALSHALVAAQFFQGDLGQVAQRARRQLAETRRLGDRFGETVARLAGITPLIARGTLDVAEAQLAEAKENWPHLGDLQGSFIAAQHANLRIARGDGKGALAILDAAIPVLRKQLLMTVPLVRIPLRDAACRAAILAGDRHRARKEIARLDKEPLAWSRALARLHEASVEGDPAMRLDAARLLDACAMPMHAAFARTRAGADPEWIPARLYTRWDDFAATYAP